MKTLLQSKKDSKKQEPSAIQEIGNTAGKSSLPPPLQFKNQDLGPGQEKQLPHELWHLVQKKQGSLQPTMQMKGVEVTGDPVLERVADVKGEKSIQRKRMGGTATNTSVLQMQEIPLNDSTVLNTSGAFRIGEPQRPSINHDNGFLDAYDEVTGKGDEKYREREPTMGDKLRLLKWKAKLEAAEGIRRDLIDGTAAYRHFLEGNGADRNFNYERYIENDPSGETVLANAIAYTQEHAQILCNSREFIQITSDAFTTNQAGPFNFPYPKTENWQKAIGGHNLWISAKVNCERSENTSSYTMEFTAHIEDRYNFNPGQADIVTGIPDSDNGIFEITGLAHQYMNFSTIRRKISWTSASSSPDVVNEETGRNRMPSDNRRLGNSL